MIVICTKCQAKFRVADERVGPRGAKVRCSRCETVFLVQPGAAPAEASAPAPGTVGLTDDPFAPAAPGAAPPRAGGADPFVVAPAPAPPSTLVTDLSDLLGPPAAAPAAKPRAVPPPLPFARTAPAVPAADPAPFPALDDVPQAVPAAAYAASPLFATPSPATGANPFAAPVRADPFASGPPAGAPDAQPPPAADDGGLALEDRFTPPPVKVAPAPEPPLEIDETSALEIAGGPPGPGAGRTRPSDAAFSKISQLASGGYDPNVADAFAPGSGDPFDAGAFEHAPGPGVLADGGRAPASAAPAVPDAAPYAQDVRELPRPAGEAPVPASAVVRAKRMAGQRSRVRALAVNAAALAALLLVALAMLAVWRTDGTLAPAALSSALLGAVRGGGRVAGPYEAREVRSGLYERLRGAPLLFVRGKVVSRATVPVPAVVVSVEVVREGAVLARAEAVAGGIATPEELYGAIDAEALARAATVARSRAPREVRPGDELPFLVAVGDAPADLDGAALRVDVAPAGGRR